MTESHVYEIDLIVRDATSEHVEHRELTTEHATPQEAAQEIIGGLYAGIGQRLKAVNDGE